MGVLAIRENGVSEAARNVTIVTICGLVLLGTAYYAVRMVLTEGAYPDFLVFWTAAQVALEDPSRLYDHHFMTQRQAWLSPPIGLRAWIYPPSALLLFVPFGFLSFWPAFWLWGVISIVAFTLASRLLVGGWVLALAIFSPAVAMAVTWGQTSLLIGAAIIVAVVKLDERPAASGALLGIVAAIKPQVLVLAPIALISARQWLALAAFCFGKATIVLASLMFGLEPWLHWFNALGGFVDVVKQNDLYHNVITPAAIASRVSDVAPTAVTVLCVTAGIGLAWWSFTRVEPEIRLTGLICGGLLISPYAMRYELAMLAPVAAAVLFSAGSLRWLASVALISVPGALALLALPASLIGFRRPAANGRFSRNGA